MCEKLILDDYKDEKERNRKFIEESIQPYISCLKTVKVFCWLKKMYSTVVTYDQT